MLHNSQRLLSAPFPRASTSVWTGRGGGLKSIRESLKTVALELKMLLEG